ncbi:efflux RND transporter periplasmic adaptor subunit [Colwellia sp. BRX8-7]|jgi:HlyD family secretion protein|uniref:efflux RND transporter periplasmic adaptor subunit n=1 Tax=Colwellia sp. BRX8-7 TaxID=2759833 RepID=UPI0015F6F5FA|nr:efflux RND transporter periplasmic adaptor subunit [Colwellia sp. BRX8-7]MBA6337834.1 efflux RND transporter periplasmic adaptor subunit [Colwellia sp. BRX8-7]
MKKILIIIAVIIGLVSLAYFKKTGQSQTLEVKVQQVAAENIKRSILASGTLVYKEQVQLRSEVIGQVSEMLIEEGDEVTKGQVLMRLEPRTFRADVEQQAAFVRIQKIAIEHQSKKIENLKSQWQRKHDLYQRKILDRDAYELIDNQYALAKIDLRSRQESLLQAQATLDKAQERLDKTVFRSPIKGIATSVDIKQGETAISGSTNISGSNLITLADPSSILIEVEVDEADIANILVGQQADIFAVAFPDKALKGQVQSIATTAKRAQGRQGLSFKVKILLSDSNTIAVRPGMSCRAEIYTQSKSKTIAVPSESVIFATQGKNVQVDDETDNEALADNVDHVFVLIDGKAVKQNVELGISNDRLQEITLGLKVGDKVIIGPARALGKLKDAQSVKVIDKEA